MEMFDSPWTDQLLKSCRPAQRENVQWVSAPFRFLVLFCPFGVPQAKTLGCGEIRGFRPALSPFAEWSPSTLAQWEGIRMSVPGTGQLVTSVAQVRLGWCWHAARPVSVNGLLHP